MLRRILRIVPSADLVTLGNPGGSWVVPEGLLTRGAVCYCAGVGEDISFDAALVEAYYCEVYAFDPTPRAIEYVAKNAQEFARFHFLPVGLWSEEATLKFYQPKDPRHVSHSVMNLQGTQAFFIAPCRTVAAIMASNGHTSLDLLKLDIEGAEYAVLSDVLDKGILPRVLCVEFDQPASPWRTISMVKQILGRGFDLVSIESWNYTFVFRGD